MVDLLALQERMLEVALQRSLPGFEQGLKRTLDLFQLNAWACLFPPSFQAGGRPLFVAHGIRADANAPLASAARQGLETLFAGKPDNPAVLATLAREMTPQPGCRCRVLRINREREVDLVLFCYRAPGDPDFTPADLTLLTRAGQLLDRCFQALAEQQQQEFLAGLFRIVGNLHPEGLCILDSSLRALFENRKFREHMLLWTHGPAALKNLTLPRTAELPPVWVEACHQSFLSFQKIALPPASGKMVVTQGPVSNLRHELHTGGTTLEGAVRYLAFQGALGVRPYVLLTSNIRQAEETSHAVPLARVAEVLRFSRRETELAELILRGASARAIGEKLKISLPTVKTHIRHILRKAGVQTRLEFAALCRDPR